MNSTKTCSAKKYSIAPYFRYSMKHNLYQLILFSVAVLLGMIVPFILDIGHHINYEYYDAAKEMIEYAYIGFVCAAVFGLFSGMTELSYVNSKQSVSCLHSFPLTRNTLFVCEIPSGIVYSFVALTIGFIAVPLTASLSGYSLTVYLAEYMAMYLASIMAFLLVHSATLLAAGLTGTAVMRFIMTAMVLFFPIALFALVVTAFQMGCDELHYGYYLCENNIKLLCPAARFVYVLNEGGAGYIVKESLLCLPYIAVHYVGAVLLNKYRRTEDTGKTIIWAPLFKVTKYLVIFAGALLGVIVFGISLATDIGEIADNIFGMFIGLVMSFVIVNCIMYRSVRMLFKDVKPFVTLSVATLVFVLVIPSNVFGIVGNMYSLNNTREFELDVYGINFTLPADRYNDIVECKSDYAYYNVIEVPSLWSDDSEELLCRDYEAYIFDDTVQNGGYEDYMKCVSEQTIACNTSVMSFSQRRSDITIIQKPKFGIPLAMSLTVSVDNDICKNVIYSEEYIDMMNRVKHVPFDAIYNIILSIGETDLNMYPPNGVEIYNRYTVEGYYQESDTVEWTKYVSAVEEIIALSEFDPEKIADSPFIGTIEFTYASGASSNTNVSIPINADNIELVNAIVEFYSMVNNTEPVKYSSSDEYFRKTLVDNYVSAIMIDTSSGESREISLERLAEYSEYSICFTQYRNWEYSKYKALEDVGYMFLTRNKDGSIDEVFMDGSRISEDELDKLFVELK